MNIWRLLLRLFVEDGAFACLVLAWVALVALLHEAVVPSPGANAMLAGGLLFLFAGGVVRAARKRRRT